MHATLRKEHNKKKKWLSLTSINIKYYLDPIVQSGLPRLKNPWYSYFHHQSPYRKYLPDLHYIQENNQISRSYMVITAGKEYKVPSSNYEAYYNAFFFFEFLQH